ncbi:MAG: tol-pal system YbgF family protein [Polyangiales bacterium]
MRPLLLLLSFVFSNFALAQDDEARIHFEAGSLHYQEANYEDALGEFERAYELSELPALLFNMSQCHERLGQLSEAISTLEAFIAGTEEGEQKMRQERRLVNLQRRYAEEQAAALAAEEAAQASAAEAEARRRPEVEPPPSPPIHGLRNAGFGVLAVGAAGLLTFAVAGSLALSSAGELDDTCGANGPMCDEDDIAPLETRMLVADIGLGIGLVAAVTGVIMVIVGSKGGDEDESQALVVPMIQREGGGAAMSLRF